jgi:hypothetical protein
MSAAPHDNRRLIDPDQFEEAGRALRRLLEAMRRPRPLVDSAATEIDWEDGEPRDEAASTIAGRR